MQLGSRSVSQYVPLVALSVASVAVSFVQAQPARVDPHNIQPNDDLRGCRLKAWGVSLADADLRDRGDVLTRVTFDTRTVWPPKDRLPPDFNPDAILERGKNPGLGVRGLHAEGITGRGVRVAIIDQPLLRDHQEYQGKVARYEAIDCAGVDPQMHGAAVASLLVGTSCGVAPGAELYYWAEPSWKRDYAQRTKALRQILEFNEGKPLERRIRVVSVSIGFNRQFNNLNLWKEALDDAKKQGLIVIHCGEVIHGVACPLDQDPDDPANYEICHFARDFRRRLTLPIGRLYLPIDNRTTAGFEGVKDYSFFADGGLSWAAPYLAGVIALGYQVNPELDPDVVMSALRETGTRFGRESWIVNPPRFITKVRPAKQPTGGS
jgi:hypothetical protein